MVVANKTPLKRAGIHATMDYNTAIILGDGYIYSELDKTQVREKITTLNELKGIITIISSNTYEY